MNVIMQIIVSLTIREFWPIFVQNNKKLDVVLVIIQVSKNLIVWEKEIKINQWVTI